MDKTPTSFNGFMDPLFNLNAKYFMREKSNVLLYVNSKCEELDAELSFRFKFSTFV